MSIMLGAARHSWTSSVLVLMFAACGGGGYKSAPSSVAYSNGGYSGDPAPPSHTAVDRGGSIAQEGPPAVERPGLGTKWGEQVDAPISFTPFVRAASSPWAEVLLHYNDAQGVEAHARHVGAHPRPLEVLAGDGSLSVSLVDTVGGLLPGFHANGRALVVGNDGERYRIVVRNGTSARFEVVTSVDGLDVIDGNPADPNRRGYIIDPHGTLTIDGFRTSDRSVAAFRFGKVADSYAAQTSGDRNVGVVGFAIFAERGAVWTPVELDRRDTANPFPARGYAVPPR